MDEAVEDVLLECRHVVGDLVAVPHMQGVVAVGEEDGLQLALVVQEVAGVDVRQLHLMLLPCTAEQRPRVKRVDVQVVKRVSLLTVEHPGDYRVEISLCLSVSLTYLALFLPLHQSMKLLCT